MLRSVSAASSFNTSAFNTARQGTPQSQLRNDDDVCFGSRDPFQPRGNRGRDPKRDETLLKQFLPWVIKLAPLVVLGTVLGVKGCEKLKEISNKTNSALSGQSEPNTNKP